MLHFSKLDHQRSIPGRSEFCMEVVGDNIFIFGGLDSQSELLIDLYTYSTSQPTVFTPVQWKGNHPSTFSAGSAVAGNHVYSFGGFTLAKGAKKGVPTNQLHVLDTTSMTWSRVPQKGTIPSPRQPSLCYYNGYLYSFFGDEDDGDIYRMNVETQTWEIIHARKGLPCPISRIRSAGVLLGKYFYVSGGYNPYLADGKRYLKDFWCFDLETHSWTLLPTPPFEKYGRDSHSLSVLNNSIYLFGGFVWISQSNRLSQYDIAQKKWIELPECSGTDKGLLTSKIKNLPLPRVFHKAVTASNDKMYLFGGKAFPMNDFLLQFGNKDQVFDDLYSIQFGENKTEEKQPRGWQCYVCHKTDGCKLCSACKAVAYCSKEHQVEDWKRHKPECAIFKQRLDVNKELLQ